MSHIVSQYDDHNEIYSPEKRGGVLHKFAKLSVPIVHDWSSINAIVTPAVRRGFWSAFRDFNWESCSLFVMCIPVSEPQFGYGTLD